MSAKYGECLACGNITGGEEYELCARCAGSPAAPAPTEPEFTGVDYASGPDQTVEFDDPPCNRPMVSGGICGATRSAHMRGGPWHEFVPAPSQPVTPTDGEREKALEMAMHVIGQQAQDHSPGCGSGYDGGCVPGCGDYWPSQVSVEAIARALARTRAEAMEEAAQVAEKQVENKRNPDSYREGWNDACWSVAAAIRAKAQGGR